jgi:hypothetical protein
VRTSNWTRRLAYQWRSSILVMTVAILTEVFHGFSSVCPSKWLKQTLTSSIRDLFVTIPYIITFTSCLMLNNLCKWYGTSK